MHKITTSQVFYDSRRLEHGSPSSTATWRGSLGGVKTGSPDGYRDVDRRNTSLFDYHTITTFVQYSSGLIK